MVQNDAQISCAVFLVAKALIDCGDGTVFVGQFDPAHPHRDTTFDESRRGDALKRAPAHNRKPVVERVFFGVAAEIGQRTSLCQAKCLCAACHGWLEQNWPKIVAIIGVNTGGCRLAGGLDATILECLRYGDFTVAPNGEGFVDIILGDLQGMFLSIYSLKRSKLR